MSAVVFDSTYLAAPANTSIAARWAGRPARTLAVLFIVFDTVIKLVSAPRDARLRALFARRPNKNNVPEIPR